MVSEAETASILKRAMGRYSINNMSDSVLGVFEGVGEDGAVVQAKLEGINLQFTSVEPVDVTKYEKQITCLEETVEKQKEEISSLKEEAKKKLVEEQKLEEESQYFTVKTEPSLEKPKRRRKTT